MQPTQPERPKLETLVRWQSRGLWALLGLALLAVALLSSGGLPPLGGVPHSYASPLPGPEGEEVLQDRGHAEESQGGDAGREQEVCGSV